MAQKPIDFPHRRVANHSEPIYLDLINNYDHYTDVAFFEPTVDEQKQIIREEEELIEAIN